MNRHCFVFWKMYCIVSLECTSYQTNAKKLEKAAIKRSNLPFYEAEALAGRVVCFLVFPSFGGWLLRDIRKELSLLLKMRLRHGHASAFLLSPLWWTGAKNTNVRVKIQTERATASLSPSLPCPLTTLTNYKQTKPQHHDQQHEDDYDRCAVLGL